jgi:hypothetical protein
MSILCTLFLEYVMTLNHPAPRMDDSTAMAPAHNGLCKVVVGGERRTSVIMRRAAGSTAAVRHSRRGSFLVLVIGILALISAFMIIYVAVGRADQQLSSAVGRSAVGLSDNPSGDSGESSRDAVAEKFAKYAAQVIADDAVATFYVNKDLEAVRADTGQAITGTIRLTREASDFPYTEWSRRSNAGVDAPDEYFSPVGTFDQFKLTVGTLPDSWAPADPWLASAEPVWMNHDALTNTSAADIENEFILRKDWQHISNFAPDGAFVNLYNLRTTSTDPYLGNYDANHVVMQGGKTLTAENGSVDGQTDFGGAINVNGPAYYTMRQRHAAVPVGSFDGAPAAVSYRPYQWADADGDGIYDSRWFEMVDIRQETSGIDVNNPRDILGIAGGEYRYFFAARAVDLSAAVNVNTAGDFVSGPTDSGDFGPGYSPAEVDLRRLLGLQDVFHEFNFAYDAMAQSTFNMDDGRPQNYFTYTNATDPMLTSLIGNRAYLSLGWSIDRGTIARLTDVNSPVDRQRFGKRDGSDSAGGTDGSKLRSEYYDRVGSRLDGISVHPTVANQFVSKKPFGTPDLIELLTFRGLNDPSYTSSLESAVGGHFEGTTSGSEDLYLRFSPLRDNRPLDLERLDSTAGVMSSDREREIYASLAADVRKRLTTLSGARAIKTSDLPAVYDEERKEYLPPSDALQETELKQRVSSSQAISTIGAYARGLVPYASSPEVWPTSPDFDQYRFLNYGYRSPEVGLRMAAQLATNLQAMKGNATGKPVVLSVPLWGKMNELLQDDGVAPDGNPTPWSSRTYKWSAWPNTTGRGDLGYPNLSRTQADNAGDELGADAVNMYGVQPQPFIVSVASYSIYTDSKDTDDEADSDTYQPGYPTGASKQVQIRGDRDISNGDYIADIFAVRVVNPFPVSITFGGDIIGDSTGTDSDKWLKSRDRYDYYLEYAGRYYRMANWFLGDNFASGDEGPISYSLGAGKSCVFYFTSLPVATIVDRLNDSQDADGGSGVEMLSAGGGAKETVFAPWLNKQLRGLFPGDENPKFIEQFDPKTGSPMPLDSGTIVDITSLDTTNPTGTAGAVRLWRAIRDDYNVELGNANEMWDETLDADASTMQSLPEQNLENDLLVDRFRDPDGGSTWRHPLQTGWNDVDGSRGWEYTGDNTNDADNDNRASGMTFTLGGVVARSSDPYDRTIERTGLLPAYCIESGFGGSVANTATRSYTIEAGYVKLDVDMITGDDRTGGRVMHKDENVSGVADSWFDSQSESLGNVEIFHTMAEAPSQWTIGGSEVSRFEAAQISPAISDQRPLLWAPSAGSKMRIGDVLLPLAIGAQYAFRVDDNPPATALELDERWLTLAESWAIALNYEDNNATLAASDRFGIYEGFGDWEPTASPRVFPATDGGRLVLSSSFSNWAAPDAATQTLSPFVPFVDKNGNGEFDRDATDTESLSLGITPAASILEQFTSVPVTPSLTRAQLGTVNISTAPLAVLRVLPMLSPTTDTMTGYDWWWTSSDQTSNRSKLDGDTDLAATVAAFRDKSWIRTRPGTTTGNTTVLAFDDRDNGGAVLSDITDGRDLNGRSGRAFTPGLREQPGLIVAGEILSAARRSDLPDGGTTVPPADPTNIDFLGMDVEATGTGSRINTQNKKGIGSFDYNDLDPVKNDYEVFEERLIVPNGVLASATTRSDFFAVWFTVAGFRPSDVRGLSNTMPLVPSMQRRFVMVVDRSNVVKKGDKPRIVFFREVPLR